VPDPDLDPQMTNLPDKSGKMVRVHAARHMTHYRFLFRFSLPIYPAILFFRPSTVHCPLSDLFAPPFFFFLSFPSSPSICVILHLHVPFDGVFCSRARAGLGSVTSTTAETGSCGGRGLGRHGAWRGGRC